MLIKEGKQTGWRRRREHLMEEGEEGRRERRGRRGKQLLMEEGKTRRGNYVN